MKTFVTARRLLLQQWLLRFDQGGTRFSCCASLSPTMADDARFAFIVEWYEEMAARTRTFQFFYFARSKSIEMFDIKSRKMFLKTNLSACPVELQDLYIGASINVLGRQLKIVDYGDEFTKRKLMSKLERTLGFIKPDCLDKFGHVLEIINDSGLMTAKIRFCKISQNDAFLFYQDKNDLHSMTDSVNSVTNGPIIVFEIVGENAVQRWQEIIGPTDPSKARAEAANSLRARFGTDYIHNAVHGSDSQIAAARELEFFFPSDKKQTFPNCVHGSGSTCCLIKPHVVKSGMVIGIGLVGKGLTVNNLQHRLDEEDFMMQGKAGKIINAIQDAGFTINTIQMFNLEKANVEEFYEIYKGVVHEYPGMVNELASGPVIAIEVLGKNPENVPMSFREFCGPMDPEIARHLRPRTLRALFGINKVQNAVHCTDLPEDAPLEVEYFFKVLDR